MNLVDKKEPFDTRHFNVGYSEKWFRNIKNTPLRFAAKIVAVTVVFVLVAGLARLTMDKAVGAPDNSGPTLSARHCVRNGEEVPCDPKVYARNKFRQGKMGRVHGVRAGRVFANPTAAKTLYVAKIKHKLANRNRHALGCDSGTITHQAVCLYTRDLDGTTCFQHQFYRAYSIGKEICSWKAPRGDGITKQQIKDYGTVTICAGGVIVGAVQPEASPLVLSYGAVTCGWAAFNIFGRPIVRRAPALL